MTHGTKREEVGGAPAPRMLLGAILLAAGCTRREPPPPPPPPPPAATAASATPGVADPRPPPWHDVPLARSTRTDPIPAGAEIIILDRRSLRRGDGKVIDADVPPPDREAAGFLSHPDGIPGDLNHIGVSGDVAVARSLAARPDAGAPSYVVVVHGSMAYKPVAEVVHSIHAGGAKPVGLVVAGPGGPALLPVRWWRDSDEATIARHGARRRYRSAIAAGDDAGPPLREDPGFLDLVIVAQKAGIRVQVRGQTLAPGCDRPAGPGYDSPRAGAVMVTLPARDGSDALSRLRTCLERIAARSAAASDADRITVAAAAEVPLERLVAIADAARVEQRGRVFFGDVLLGDPE